jgi:hypothetical protein
MTAQEQSKRIEVTMKAWTYNERRYFFWLSIVKKFNELRPDCNFIKHDEENGKFVFFAEPGDVIYYGLKDNRKNYNERCWGLVTADGTVEKIDKRQARKQVA